MEASSFVIMYFGMKMFVRFWEVCFEKRRPLMEAPL